MSSKSSSTTALISVVVQKPNRFRWEVTGSGAATYTGMYVGEETMVSDGNNVFWYQPKLKEYTKVPISEPVVTPMGTVPAFIEHIEDNLFDGFKHLGADGWRFLKEETILKDGLGVDCYVVETTTEFQTTFKWWVDKKRHVVLREVFELNPPGQFPTLTRRTEFATMEIGGPIDEQSFVFVPPAGAKKRE